MLWLLLFYAIVQYVVIKINGTDITALADKINAYIQDFSDVFVLISVKLAEYGIFQKYRRDISRLDNKYIRIASGKYYECGKFHFKSRRLGNQYCVRIDNRILCIGRKNKILYYCKNIVEVFFHKRAENIKRILSFGNKYIFPIILQDK